MISLMRWTINILVLLVSSLSGFNISATTLDFDNKYWLQLLHYQNGKSLADGEKFFLAPNGNTNPEAELKATIIAFKDPDKKVGWFNYHPQCVFRERFRFLKSEGLLDDVPVIPCEVFDEWKNGLNAESVTLIFSSSYPNNPSSLFGHTLLRLNQKNKKNDLLDYAVAFSAVPEKEDLGLIFAFKGFFGGYKGLFEITKYYTKVNEYSNGESRDLIEYNLEMNEAQLDRMINHLWELYQTTYFDYYFADENCSAVLADLLAVAYKDDNQVNAHARWYYLPGEMVKHFNNEGKIKSVNYRASLKKQIEKMWEGLSPQDINEVKYIINRGILPAKVSSAKVLDAVIAYLDFTHYRTKKKLSEADQKLLRTALIKRSGMSKAETIVSEYNQNNRPEKAHAPEKWSLFTRVENKKFLSGFEIKQGYHDLMSNDQGYDAFSQFDFLYGSLIYDYKNKKISYDQLALVNLVSLHEYRFYDPQLSWKASVIADRIYDLDCQLCHKLNLTAYGGFTSKFSSNSVFNMLAGVFGEASSHLKNGFRLGTAGEISFYTQVGNHYKLGLYDEIRFDATKNISQDYYNQFGIRHAYFNDNIVDFRLETKVLSKFGSFKKNTVIHQVTYGQYF
jgi:hypothetical protein